MCPDSPENKCPTVECPDCGGQGSDEGGFRGGKKWKAICPRCDLAARAILLQEDAASQIYWDDAGDSDRAQAVEDAQYAVRAAARAIAAAAYRQGREDLEARIEELAEVHEIKASITESDRKARELDRRAELLRSLLTDKEDNNE